jgi:cephalosporin-C deacetylase-like acetyl esterase
MSTIVFIDGRNIARSVQAPMLLAVSLPCSACLLPVHLRRGPVH